MNERTGCIKVHDSSIKSLSYHSARGKDRQEIARSKIENVFLPKNNVEKRWLSLIIREILK
jgi:hypothetical protein